MSTAALLKKARGAVPNRQQLARQWKAGDTMFANPAWFQLRRQGWGIRPVRWQGWAYSFICVALIVMPFFLLMTQFLVPEALAWVTLGVSAFLFDVSRIRREIRVAEKVIDVPGSVAADSIVSAEAVDNQTGFFHRAASK